MASVFPQSRGSSRLVSPRGAPRLARAMSRHSSAALLTFALVQIAGVVALNSLPGGQLLPFVALALLVLLAVPFARRLDRRWQELGATALPSSGLIRRFRRDRSRLWTFALAVPVLWFASFAAVAEATAIAG